MKRSRTKPRDRGKAKGKRKQNAENAKGKAECCECGRQKAECRAARGRSERLPRREQLHERLSKEKADAAPRRHIRAAHASAAEQKMRQQQAKDASEQMEQAAKDLQEAREQQVGEWKKELTEALDESIQELLQMAREESALEEKARSAGRDNAKTEQIRGQQSAVQQGVDKTAERLQREGQKTSLLRAAHSARWRSQAARRAGEPQRPSRAAAAAASTLGEAAESLNRAAAALARDRERANSATSATGLRDAPAVAGDGQAPGFDHAQGRDSCRFPVRAR